MAREKHVFDTDEIAHLWAHKTQHDARNKQGNFYFDGDTIYSYGRHFPIARHVTGINGEAGILFTTRGYSNTTSGHISQVRHAIPDEVSVFYTEHPDNYPNSVFACYRETLASNLKNAIAPRLRDVTRARLLDRAIKTADEANRYALFAGLKDRLELPANAEIDALKETARETEAARVKAERGQRERERAAAEAYMLEHAACFGLWRKTGATLHSHGSAPEYLRFPKEALLRVDGEEIQTSHGARVPVEHARKAYRIVRALKDAGKTYKRNGHTIHIGHYPLDSVDADGTIKAGCHVIAWGEVERLAVAQGWSTNEVRK